MIYIFLQKEQWNISKEKLLDQDELTELFRDHERMYQGIVSQNGIKGIKNAKINTGFSNGIPLDMANR